MSLANILIVVSALIVFVLGAVILATNKKKAVNQLLAAFEFSAVLWLITNLLTNISQDNVSALFYARTTLVGGVLMPFFILLFASAYAEKHLSKFLKIAITIPAILLLLSVPTEWNVISVSPKGADLKTGPVYILLVAYIFIYVAATLRLLWKKYRQSRNQEQRSQLLYMFSGAILMVVPAVVLSAILPVMGYSSTADYGPLSVVILAFFTSTAIVKHQFLNVRIIVARSLAYILSILAIVAFFALLSFGLASYVFNVDLISSEVIFFALFSAITALAFQPVKKFFDKFSNRIFYRDAYDAQELLNRVNSALVSTTDLYKLLEQAAKEVKTNIKASFCNFYIDNRAVIDFHVVGTDTPMFAKDDWKLLLKEINESKEKLFAESIELE